MKERRRCYLGTLLSQQHAAAPPISPFKYFDYFQNGMEIERRASLCKCNAFYYCIAGWDEGNAVRRGRRFHNKSSEWRFPRYLLLEYVKAKGAAGFSAGGSLMLELHWRENTSLRWRPKEFCSHGVFLFLENNAMGLFCRILGILQKHNLKFSFFLGKITFLFCVSRYVALICLKSATAVISSGFLAPPLFHVGSWIQSILPIALFIN